MPETKQRHGCLMLYLVVNFVLLLSVVTACIFAVELLQERLPWFSGWVVPVTMAKAICGIICVIALFYWKKWGFWGFCALTFIGFFTSFFIGIPFIDSLEKAANIIILYGVLHIGKHNKGWPQLD